MHGHEKVFSADRLNDWANRIDAANKMIDKMGEMSALTEMVRIDFALNTAISLIKLAKDLTDEVTHLRKLIGEPATKDAIENHRLIYGQAYSYDGLLLDPKKVVIHRVAKSETKWVRLCRRTNDPKLAWIERQLDKLGIQHRRHGESRHAPILEIDKADIGRAWDLLDPIDDIPDDDPRWVTDIKIGPEVEHVTDLVVLLKDIHDEADCIIQTIGHSDIVKNAKNIKKWAKECLDKICRRVKSRSEQ